MDCVLRRWLERSKLFRAFLLHFSALQRKEEEGPLACFPPALSASSAHLLFILYMLGAHMISACIWPGKGASCSTWPAAAWCDKTFPMKARIWPWEPSYWDSRTQNSPFGPSTPSRNWMPVQVAQLAPGWNGAKNLLVQSVWEAAGLQRDPHTMSLRIQTWWF